MVAVSSISNISFKFSRMQTTGKYLSMNCLSSATLSPVFALPVLGAPLHRVFRRGLTLVVTRKAPSTQEGRRHSNFLVVGEVESQNQKLNVLYLHVGILIRYYI